MNKEAERIIEFIEENKNKIIKEAYVNAYAFPCELCRMNMWGMCEVYMDPLKCSVYKELRDNFRTLIIKKSGEKHSK